MSEFTIADVSAGDRVTLEHNDGSILPAREVFDHPKESRIDTDFFITGLVDDRASISEMLAVGWRITAVVKPEPALPTESDSVVLFKTIEYRTVLGWLGGDGLWDLIDPRGNSESKVADPYEWIDQCSYGRVVSFTRLAPVPETAEKVLTGVVALMNDQKFSAEKAINRVAAEFGVTS